MKKLNRNAQSGFTIMETLMYMAFFIVIMLVVVTSIVTVVKSQRNVRMHLALQESAIVAFDKIVREIRDARDVDLVLSEFGQHPGVLSLITTDTAGSPRTVEFYLDSEDGRLMIMEDSVELGPLIHSGVTVDSLVFRYIGTANSDAVRVEMALSADVGDMVKTEDFSTTAILRGSY